MYPFLVDDFFLGIHLKIPSFGVLLALSFSAAYFLSLRNAKLFNIPSRAIEILFILIVAGSILGGRLFHVFFEDPLYYFSSPTRVFAVWEGGFTFYGAVLFSLFILIVFCKWRRLPQARIWDIAATSTMLSLFLGRLGCFFAGCCWGKVCALPWGMVFSHPLSFTPNKTVPLHPTQLYESLGAFLIFIYAQYSLNKKIKPGITSLRIFLSYGILRFFIEFFRGDEYRGYLISHYLSYSQTISIIIIIFALMGLRKLKLKS